MTSEEKNNYWPVPSEVMLHIHRSNDSSYSISPWLAMLLGRIPSPARVQTKATQTEPPESEEPALKRRKK